MKGGGFYARCRMTPADHVRDGLQRVDRCAESVIDNTFARHPKDLDWLTMDYEELRSVVVRLAPFIDELKRRRRP